MGTSKNRKSALENVDLKKSYTIYEASAIIKDNAKSKFDESVELAVRLGVDPRQANQMVRGVASLPPVSVFPGEETFSSIILSFNPAL